MHDGRVYAALLQRAQGGAGRGGDREQASRPGPVKQRLGKSDCGVAPRDHGARRDGAREQSQAVGVTCSVWGRPACAADSVIGQVGCDESFTDATHTDCDPVAERPTKRGSDMSLPIGEELLDGGRESSRQPERGLDRRDIPTGLDRSDQLAAHTRPDSELGLRQSAFPSTLAQRRSNHC
jgi:hypothetical protein